MHWINTLNGSLLGLPSVVHVTKGGMIVNISSGWVVELRAAGGSIAERVSPLSSRRVRLVYTWLSKKENDWWCNNTYSTQIGHC